MPATKTATKRSARFRAADAQMPNPHAIVRTLYTKPSGIQSDLVGAPTADSSLIV